MACLVHTQRLLTTLAAIGFTAALGAQTVSPLAKPPATTATGNVSTTPAPARERAISPGVAAALAASMPKYTPPPPKPAPVPEEELPDLRDTDKPKNTIVRLPKFVVREAKPPVFRERDLNTKQGLANIAMRRYLTETDRALNRYTIPLFHPISLLGGTSNEDRAMAMYAEDERLKNMSDVADQTNMLLRSNNPEGSQLKAAAQNTFMRREDFSWDTGRKK